jgi:hypothetical protein
MDSNATHETYRDVYERNIKKNQTVFSLTGDIEGNM